MVAEKRIRIATRKSALALWQSNYVRAELVKFHPELEVELIGVTTSGDRVQNRPLSEIGGKGLFIKELEVALAENRADIAVHSMKDVPMQIPTEFAINTICRRADVRDAFISNDFSSMADVPPGGTIGTSSIRRKSQLKAAYPELDFIDLRGNVDTRIGKLDAGNYDGIILAVAGLERLGLGSRITTKIEMAECLPAAGQGAIGIEHRTADGEIEMLISALNDQNSRTAVSCERAMTEQLLANCELPVAAYAFISAGQINLTGLVASDDGRKILRAEKTGDKRRALQIGKDLAEQLLEKGADEILGRSS